LKLHSISQTLVAWGPLGLLLVAILDSAGIPLVGGVDGLLIAVAALKPSSALALALLATAGSLAGCMLLFYIARKGGERYLDKHTQTGRGLSLRLWFKRYGLATVFVPALLPIPLPTKVFVICAGALGVRAVPFLLVVLAARIPRYVGLAYLGAQLGAHAGAWLRAHAWHVAAAAVVLFVCLFFVIRLVERSRAAREPAAD
jgi:membrane protein YqaA with SNARE-associated domain